MAISVKFLRIIVILELAAIVMLSLARISGRSPHRTPHRDHHQQFEDDFDPRRDVGHEFDYVCILCMTKVNLIPTTNMMWVRIHMMLVSIDSPHPIMVGNVQCRVT